MSTSVSKVTLLPDEHTKNKTPNLDTQFEMRGIEQGILAAFKKLKADGASYVFLVMFILDKVGFAQATEAIKAIAKVEQILQKIMGDLGDFSQLLKALLNQIDLSDYCKKGGNKGDPIAAAKKAIGKWLGEGHNGPKGNMTNGQYFRYLFEDLFGKNGKSGLLAQYKQALKNPWIKQSGDSTDSVVKGLQKLLTGNVGEGFGSANFSSGKTTFLDFLTGKVPYNPNTMAGTLAKAVAYSWFERTGSKPLDKTYADKSYTVDYIGDSTNDIDGTKGAANGINTSDSSKESMQAQNLESLQKTGSTIISNYSNFTQAAANNQKAQ
ncbi:MAG: hypothetical protein K940chlam1_01217 [Candidatus Anoxychlamydiales bacterium]|nr:hypothetical protein [Candidatus Anoxychlamydiales bacterium]NGX36130.1 hypothetical protein [Candidatus Anoxychlamydiales bacterium]